MQQKPRFSAARMAYIALGVALISVCAWISIPAAVPFTMQTFGVLLVCALLGGRDGALCVLLYILLGAVGLPVFSGFSGGVGALTGATGGYIAGFLLTALVMAVCARLPLSARARLLAGMIAGMLVCYAAGTLWFVYAYAAKGNQISFLTALSLCVLPYLIPDGVKLALAFLLQGRIRRALNRAV